MSDDTTTPTPSPEQELQLLKQRADTMGIPYKGNIGVEALKKKIETKLAGKDAETSPEPVEEEGPKIESKLEKRNRIRKEEMALVRCQIYNLDPSKRDLPGEIRTVHSKYTGTVRKFIPFGEATENGYHIERIMFNHLKSRRFQQLRRVGKGDKARIEPRMVPEYNLVELPPLTKEELEDLAIKQAAAERIGDPE